MKITLRNMALLATVSSAAVLAACGGGSEADATHGTLGVYLTDAPACGFDNVYVTVDKVRAHKSADAEGEDGEWVDIPVELENAKIDLLDLSNGVLAKLGDVSLPTGTYTQLRLVLKANVDGETPANSVVPTGGDGSEIALVTPSGQQSGIKINGNIEVAADTTTEVALDFDACKSVVTRGNGSYGLKPVISMVKMATSGAISGVIDPAVAAADNPLVSAQVDGVVVKSTVPAENGEFSLSPLAAGTYTVVVTSDAHATDVIADVPVTAGGDTEISSSTSPLTPAASTTSTLSGKVTPEEAEALVTTTQTFASGTTVTIKYQNVDVVTGDYSMTLPVAAPRYGQYGSGTLPIVVTAEAAIAGKYAAVATATGYQPQSVNVDVSAGNIVQDFTLTE